MPHVGTGIEINASPATVRSIFLDFDNYKNWSKWTIEITTPNKTPSTLAPNDYLKVNLGGGMTFSPAFISSTPEEFIWEGSLPYIFTGRHHFRFANSEKFPGGCKFDQWEDFSGLLSFLMSPSFSFQKGTLDKWDAMCEDLKKEAEKREGKTSS